MKKKEKEIQPWWQPSIVFFADLNGWIFGPVLVAVGIGSWLDKRYNTESKFTIVFVGIAFLISMYKIITIAREEMKRLGQQKEKKSKNKQSNIESHVRKSADN